MNNIMIVLLGMIGTATAVYTDVPSQMARILDETLDATQQVCTAGDMHSITTMLGAGYIMDKRLPDEEDFVSWLGDTFQENNVKNLAADHWGTLYLYRVSDRGRSYQLISAGSDRIHGTADDLVKSGP